MGVQVPGCVSLWFSLCLLSLVYLFDLQMILLMVTKWLLPVLRQASLQSLPIIPEQKSYAVY